MRIVGFVGMPGSGKGVASQIAREMGISVVVMGDVIREEAARQGLLPTDANLGRIGSDLRKEEGADAVARRTLELARATGEEVVVVDGLRSREEADFFRANADEFYLIEICAPVQARLTRLATRGRPDDPELTERRALERREERELSWGMREAMRTADITLKNDGDLEEFRRNVRHLLEVLASRKDKG